MTATIAFFGRYIWWHYTTAIVDLVRLGKNFFWFVGHFFSFGTLLRTFFNPWKRMSEQYPSIIEFGAFLDTFLVNILMRVVGIITRSVLLIAGLLSFILTFVFFIFSFVVWLLAPIIIGCIFGIGIYLLFIL